MFTVRLLFTEPVIIIHRGMALIIIQDHGHGASILAIRLISVGGLDGDTARAGSASDLVMDMAMAIMVTRVVAGGVLPFIILPAGVDGMAAQGLTVSMEIIFMYIIISM